MKKTVLLYNINEEQYGQVSDYMKGSFDVVKSSQFFDLQSIFKENEVAAVLASNQSGNDVHQLFKKHYPEYPCVFLDERVKSELTKPHIRFIEPSAKVEEIEKAINKSIAFGDKNKKQMIYTESAKMQEKLNNMPGLDVEDYLENALSVLGKYLKAENIVWIEKDRVNYYLHEMWKVQTLNGHLQSRGRGEEQRTIFSLKGATPNDVSKCLQAFTSAAGSSWVREEKIQYAGGTLSVPAIKGNTCYGYFVAIGPQNYDCYKVHSVLEQMSSYLAMRYELSFEYSRVRKMSYLDDLTELYNQRYLSMAIDKCIDKYENYGECFSVLFMDIDHFKKVNDKRGHLVGSKILIELGKILKQNIRSIDFGFRYGGDEYLLLLSNTDPETAEVVAERIRSQVESTVFDIDGQEIQITLSIGIACFPLHAKTRQDVLEMADKAMYYGKNKSRNIVYMAS